MRGQPGLSLRPVPSLQFFVMLLLVLLLEATVAILFFAYTDKVRPPAPALLTTRRGAASLQVTIVRTGWDRLSQMPCSMWTTAAPSSD